MDPQQHQWIAALESEWSEPNGFLYKVREGSPVLAQAEPLLKILEDIRAASVGTMERRLLSLVWYLPLFLSWQSERVLEAGGDGAAYEKWANRVEGLVQEILGLP
jgi:hypothetical protein